MLQKAIRMTGLAALGGLALYAGYSAIDGDSLPGKRMFSAKSAPTAPTDTWVTANLAGDIENGVPAGMGPLVFANGQRADRIAKASDADDLYFAAFHAEEETNGGRQIRGLPERQDEEKPATTQNPVKSDKPDDGKFFTTNPRRADKKDDGAFVTTNQQRTDKTDDGKFFSANPRLIAKKDDGDFYTANTPGGEFDPCLKADGTPYQGPGTALNPFAPTNPCLPKATAESYAEVVPPVVTPEPEPRVTRTRLPARRDYFAPEPALPKFGGGSDYKVI